MITAFLFWGKLIDEGHGIDWRHLYIGRLFRLYPAYSLMFTTMLVAIFALSDWTVHEGMTALLQQLGQWLLFTIPTYPDINHLADTAMMIAYVTWTLRYEWLFYVSLPLLGLLFTRSRLSPAVLVTAALILLMFRLYDWRSPFDWHILITFSGGILAAYWVRYERLKGAAQSETARGSTLPRSEPIDHTGHLAGASWALIPTNRKGARRQREGDLCGMGGCEELTTAWTFLRWINGLAHRPVPDDPGATVES